MKEKKRFAKNDTEFLKFYNNEIHDIVSNLEKERKRFLFKFFKNSFITGIVLFVLFIIGFVIGVLYVNELAENIFIPFVYVLFGFPLVLIAIYFSKQREMETILKKEIVSNIVTFLHDDFVYRPDSSISTTHFNNSRISEMIATHFRGDDYIGGTVGNTKVEFSEYRAYNVKTWRNRNGDKRQRTKLLFRGMFFAVDFNKQFDDLTLAFPKHLFNRKRDDLKTLSLENLDFDKKFFVQSKDEVSARYILTPLLMERLYLLSIKTNYKPYFSFHNGMMYLGLESKKHYFTFRLHRKVTLEKVSKFFKEINYALEIVDELNLNTRIWNKN